MIALKTICKSAGILSLLVALSACEAAQEDVKTSNAPMPADNTPVNTETFNIETMTCWDVLTVQEDNMDMVLMLLHGYNSGTAKAALQSSSEIKMSFGKAIAFCEVNPDKPALNGFK